MIPLSKAQEVLEKISKYKCDMEFFHGVQLSPIEATRLDSNISYKVPIEVIQEQYLNKEEFLSALLNITLKILEQTTEYDIILRNNFECTSTYDACTSVETGIIYIKVGFLKKGIFREETNNEI